MSKEEFLEKIQMVYVGDRNALSECVAAYNERVEREEREEREEKLIRYLESMLDGTFNDDFIVTRVNKLLERVKSDKYES